MLDSTTSGLHPIYKEIISTESCPKERIKSSSWNLPDTQATNPHWRGASNIGELTYMDGLSLNCQGQVGLCMQKRKGKAPPPHCPQTPAPTHV